MFSSSSLRFPSLRQWHFPVFSLYISRHIRILQRLSILDFASFTGVRFAAAAANQISRREERACERKFQPLVLYLVEFSSIWDERVAGVGVERITLRDQLLGARCRHRNRTSRRWADRLTEKKSAVPALPSKPLNPTSVK